jgi:hypothetical protein
MAKSATFNASFDIATIIKLPEKSNLQESGWPPLLRTIPLLKKRAYPFF